MNFTLYQNISENNRISKNLTNIGTLTGVLKESTSILDPILRVSGLTGNMVCTANYAYISDFGRYYFIKEISSIRNNLWEISCHVDVLQTYSNQIKAQTAVIKRQEKLWNLYLDDGIFKTYQNPNIITKAFPNGFNTQKFVLAVAGG